jgi:predicted O-methyltransferase YrrM
MAKDGTRMSLNDELRKIARWYGIGEGELIRYAAEDTLLGGEEGNPMGTSYAVDGHLLYALVRYCKPERILEIGTDHGGSAKHMAAACARNKKGYVTTIDNNPESGDGLTVDDQPWITQIINDAALWVPSYEGPPFDFIFEDGAHTEFLCHVIYANLDRLLRVGGFILSHDVNQHVGHYILNGIRRGGVDMAHVHIVVPNPSPLGFSIYQYQETSYEVIA